MKQTHENFTKQSIKTIYKVLYQYFLSAFLLYLHRVTEQVISEKMAFRLLRSR